MEPHTQELIQKYARQLLPLIGGILVGKGLVPDWFVKAVISQSDTIISIVGLTLATGSAIWMARKNTKPALALQVDQLKGVNAVVTNNTEEGRAIAAAVPSRTVAPVSSNPGVSP